MGKVRKANEDYYAKYESEKFGTLVIVCDGMGGYKGGSLASRLAVENIHNHSKGITGEFLPQLELYKATCFCCNSHKNITLLQDGRKICLECKRSAITDYNTAVRTLEEVRDLMAAKLGIKTNHKIEYDLVDKNTLMLLATSRQPGNECGLFNYEDNTLIQTTITNKSKKTKEVSKKQKYKIYILSYLPIEKFREVVAHELAHDWMQEYYPRIRDLQIIEGFAEYVAYCIVQIYGHYNLADYIAKNKDPIYGGGFRKIYSIASRSAYPIEELKKYFKNYGS
ncbi:MAG TPA: hypothetical protein PLI27_08855 [Ignavibacteriales bacterium]|nr:hypothetical protein [Ignavibacteriales bacterium]HOL81424.1 hypothetical protein [Ignavibacteriales bacterium]HOM65538.1 hypothetical protein [Ignavibacteriales bacterium]HPD68167.1 hypothetical protein [Ignavibacteriales bacterium]HPP34346.1 hypothetical protein [Ignavibacteriales bacterium]